MGAAVLTLLAGVLVGLAVAFFGSRWLLRAAAGEGDLAMLTAARANAWADVARDLAELAADEDARGRESVANALWIHARRAEGKAALRGEHESERDRHHR